MNRLFVALALAIPLAACDGGEDPPIADSCQEIADACHDVDPGTGEISECHDTAHDEGTAEACDPIREHCLMLCEAAAHADGGAADAGHH